MTIGAFLPVSYHPLGRVSSKFRYFCAKRIVKEIGVNVLIEKGALLQESTIIGDCSGVGVNCLITNNVTIGKNVRMAPECLIFTRNHKFNKDKLEYDGYTETRPVIIEDDVWLGTRCIILPGVTIGRGSTVGAGAVVTKSVPPYSVAVGNPARVIKNLLD